MAKTRLSSKGQIVLPLAIRTSRSWKPGTEFTLEETDEGILLRAMDPIAKTTLDQVVGCLRSKRKATIAQMKTAIRKEVQRRHDSGRY